MLNAGCRAEEIDSERERERDRSAPTIDVRVREGILGSAEGDVRRAVEQPEERTLRQQPVVHLVEPAATIAYDFLVQVPTKGSVLLWCFPNNRSKHTFPDTHPPIVYPSAIATTNEFTNPSQMTKSID